MFRKMCFVFSCIFFLCSTQVYAHGSAGHGTHVTAKEVVDVATKYVLRLVKKKSLVAGKPLDDSWLTIPTSAKSMAREAAWYYVVQIHHAHKNKTLYLLISKAGKLYRADYQGVFKEFD